MRNRTIQYGINQDTGLVWSRVNSEIAVPILDWYGMTPENGFQTSYYLEKYDILSLTNCGLESVKWTRKIPTEIKNLHRKFWDMKPLKEK